MTDTDTPHDSTNTTIIDIREQNTTTETTDNEFPWLIIAFAALGGLFVGAALMALTMNQTLPLLVVIA